MTNGGIPDFSMRELGDFPDFLPKSGMSPFPGLRNVPISYLLTEIRNVPFCQEVSCSTTSGSFT